VLDADLTEADAAADVTWDDTSERVLDQVKALKAPEGADAGRDLTMKAVVAQVEQAQEGEVADGGGDGAGEPLGTEVQGYHPPPVPPAAGDALPAAVAGALVPRVQHARAAGHLCLESEKSSFGTIMAWLAWRGSGCTVGCGGREQQKQLEEQHRC